MNTFPHRLHPLQTSVPMNAPARSAPERNDGGERDRRGEFAGKLVVACGDTAEVFQTAERGLDTPALSVASPVVADLPFAGTGPGDHRCNAFAL
jgi:hypothetical protein